MKPLRIHGVPIHPILVHFPVAAWTGATLAAVAGVIHPIFLPVAQWCNLAGLIIAPFAIATGLLEYMRVPADQEILTTANRHLLLVTGAFAVYLLLLLFQSQSMHVASAITSSLGLVLLILGGHAGARLVYHHHLPVSEESD